MTISSSPTRIDPTTEPAGRIRYGYEVPVLLVAAFTLSVAHTIYAWRSGLEDPDFTVTSPLTWGFYAVAFAMAALARKDALVAQVVVLSYLVAVVGIARLLLPDDVHPRAADDVRVVRERHLHRTADDLALPVGDAAASTGAGALT